MDFEQIPAAEIGVGDLVRIPDHDVWSVVDDVRVEDDAVVLRLESLKDGGTTMRTFDADQLVRRGDRDAAHGAEEFLGLTLVEARAWAAALGWRLFGPGTMIWGGDSGTNDSVVVSVGCDGRVDEARFV